MKKASLVLPLALITLFSGCTPTQEQPNSFAPSSEQQAANSCAIGIPLTGKIYVKGHDVPMLTGPGFKYSKVINQKFTEVTGRTEYRTLGSEYTLEGLCQKDSWVQAKIIEAGGSSVEWETGWVNKKYLSGNISAERQAGLIWDIDNDSDLSKAEKNLFKKASLKILKDESNCKEIIVGATSQQKGNYFVTCNPRNGGEVYNVFFNPKQVTGDASITTPTVFPEEQSRKACEDAIRGNTVHPSTLNIYRFLGYATFTSNNGNRTIMQGFSAKNAFGLELKYEARCLIMPDGQVELTVNETK